MPKSTTPVAISRYPELEELAMTIAKDVCKRINKDAPKIESKMPYRQQYVLEELLKILQEAV